MFAELLTRLAAGLDGHGIPYMVIGGQAVLVYGEPRLTRDIDIALGLDLGRLPDLLMVVSELALRPLPEDVPDFVSRTMVLPTVDEPTGIRVDLILSNTAYEAEAIRRAREVLIDGTAVRFASPEDLLVHKVFAGRPRDLEDARSVMLRVGDLDLGYVRRWLTEFDALRAAPGEARYADTLDEIVRSLPRGG